MRPPRGGQPLHITARAPAGGSSVEVTGWPVSGPGGIYPSIADLPTPGCWHMTLEWSGHTATIDLPYGA